ncbi:MAG: hypothetical protein JXA42_01930 [Anaerolineales bacterium]|nr:hypothetical protein [Anaerolineales bacterium]
MNAKTKTDRSRIITFVIISLLLLAVIWIVFQSSRDDENTTPPATLTKESAPTEMIEETSAPPTEPEATQAIQAPGSEEIESYPYPGVPPLVVSPPSYPIPTVPPPTPYPDQG